MVAIGKRTSAEMSSANTAQRSQFSLFLRLILMPNLSAILFSLILWPFIYLVIAKC